jgi:hypothetical protein
MFEVISAEIRNTGYRRNSEMRMRKPLFQTGKTSPDSSKVWKSAFIAPLA